VERSCKAIRDMLRRLCSLSSVVHVRKIKVRKQTTDIEKYSFVNRTIENWKQLPAEVLGPFFVNLRFLGIELGNSYKWG